MNLSKEEVAKIAQAKELCLEMNRLLRALVSPPLQPRTERDAQIGVPAGVIATAQAITEILPKILELAKRAQEEK